ncbi:MAG: BamA/TamA family outer membrane protein [bacterium]
MNTFWRVTRVRGASGSTLVLSVALCVSAVVFASRACAEPRFGDSTWVAPSAAVFDDSTAEGPRVAKPDHERRWETALRTPFRVAFLPLRFAARGLEAGVGRYGERLLTPKPKRPPKRFSIGPRIDLGGAKDGDLNDVGLGPSLDSEGFPVSSAELSLHGSWTINDRRRVRFTGDVREGRPVSFRVRGDYDYKPNRRYYGVGNDVRKEARAYFLLENTRIEAELVLGASQVRQLRFLGGFSSMSPRRGSHGSPLLEDVFNPTNTPFYHETTRELLYGVSGDFAALDDRRDPSHGFHGHADLRHAVGLDDGDPDYNQWFFEGRTYIPVFAKRRVIAVRCVYAGIDPTGDGATQIPFYRLTMSDGPMRFAAYASQRFRDRQLMLARVEYRWMIWRRLSAVALYDLGEVAPNLKAFTARGAHASYGGGLRIGVGDGIATRFDVATGSEGINAVVRLGSGF